MPPLFRGGVAGAGLLTRKLPVPSPAGQEPTNSMDPGMSSARKSAAASPKGPPTAAANNPGAAGEDVRTTPAFTSIPVMSCIT